MNKKNKVKKTAKKKPTTKKKVSKAKCRKMPYSIEELSPKPCSINIMVRGRNDPKDSLMEIPVCEIHWKDAATKEDAEALKKIFLKETIAYYRKCKTSGKKAKN